MVEEKTDSKAGTRLAAVEEISRAVSSTLDLSEVLSLLLDKMTTVMGADRSTLYLVDPDQEQLWSVIVQGTEVEIRLPIGGGIAGAVARTGEPCNIADAYEDPRFNPEVDKATGYRTRSLMAAPLRNRHGQITGVLQVLNRLDGKPFDGDDLSLLEAVSSQAAVAIENARLYDSVVQQNRELDALLEIEREISQTRDPDKLIGRLLAKAIEIIGSEAGSVLLVSEEDRGKLFFHTALGEKGDLLKEVLVEGGKGIAGWVVQHDQPALVNDVKADGRFDPWLAEMVDFPARQILSVPLHSDDEAFGAIELINSTRDGRFTPADERLLKLIGSQVARAVTDAREAREQAQRERLADIGRMLSGVLHDFKSPMTALVGYIELMALEKDKEKRARFSKNVLHQIEAMDQMTKDLMAFARGESSIFVRKVFLNRFLDDLKAQTDFECRDSTVEVSWDRAYEGAAYFDPDRMGRALLNIIRNAREAMPRGGRIGIVCASEDGNIVFRVADNGPGIPEEIRSRLFDSFVTSGKENGTGLGLAIVKSIVEEHGGSVEVDTGTDVGTTFTVRLPQQKT